MSKHRIEPCSRDCAKQADYFMQISIDGVWMDSFVPMCHECSKKYGDMLIAYMRIKQPERKIEVRFFDIDDNRIILKEELL
jgi:hypothetical protein